MTVVTTLCRDIEKLRGLRAGFFAVGWLLDVGAPERSELGNQLAIV